MTPTPERRGAVRLETALSIADPERRLAALDTIQRNTDDVAARIRAARAEAVRELADDGWTWEDIGALLGVTRQRAQQIAANNHR